MANVSTIQYENLASESVNSTQLMGLVGLVNEKLCYDDSNVDGVVVTHGTDTTAETAFALDTLVNCNKPVIVTASMRPGTAVSPDGPGNLLDAINAAGSESSKGRGTMIILNDRIQDAYYAQKNNANNNDAFESSIGQIGMFLNYKPLYYYAPSTPTYKKTFNYDETTKNGDLPKVDIVYASQDTDENLVIAASATGSKGVVIAAMGEGSVPSQISDVVKSLVDQNIPVVVSHNPLYGAAPPSESSTPYIRSGFIHAAQAKLLLQFALANGYNMDQVRDLFEGGFRQALGYN